MRDLPDHAIDHLRLAVRDEAPDFPASPDPRYRIIELLGRGGMGEVYLAVDEKLEREVALKLLRPDASHRSLRDRMVREAKVLARLEHPGIVPVYDVGPLEGDRFHYAMKRVEGEPLAVHLERHRGRSERLRLFLRLCEPVAFAHDRGVVHRDLKPQNVMVGSFGEVVVLDWGIAKVGTHAESDASLADSHRGGPDRDSNAVDDDPASTRAVAPPTDAIDEDAFATSRGQVLGTPGYMAPEQARGDSHAAGPATDVYALGVMLRESLSTSDRGSDARLDAIVARATAPTLSDRYPNALALSADLSRYVDGESVHAYREGPIERSLRFLHRYRTPIGLVGAYLVVRVLIHVFQEAE